MKEDWKSIFRDYKSIRSFLRTERIVTVCVIKRKIGRIFSRDYQVNKEFLNNFKSCNCMRKRKKQ